MWSAPATAAAVALAGTAALAVVDPTSTHVPLCPLKAVTGLDCPLCGGLRAVHALTRGDIGTALDHNVLVTVGLPFAVAFWAIWMAGALRHGRRAVPLPRALSVTLLVLLVGFAVLRNLEPLDWLASAA